MGIACLLFKPHQEVGVNFVSLASFLPVTEGFSLDFGRKIIFTYL